MAHLLEHFIHHNNHGKMVNILRKMKRTKMDSFDTNTYAHQTCLEVRNQLFTPAMKEKIVLLQACLSLGDILPSVENQEAISDDILADVGCGRYSIENEKRVYNKEYLHLNIKAYQEQRKIIFIMFGFTDYFVYPFQTGNGHLAHSVCAILVPRKEHYECYYINSHGQDMMETDFYEWPISRKRVKRVHYTKPVDVIFMENLVRFWNSQSVESNNYIHYNDTARYTYLGPNLQAGDNHGVCFMFPQIIWYYIGRYYHKRHYFQYKEKWHAIFSGEKLIRNGNLSLFVISCFGDFCPKYEENIGEQWLSIDQKKLINYKSLQDIIETRQTRFIKSILRALVHFVTQRYFKKNN